MGFPKGFRRVSEGFRRVSGGFPRVSVAFLKVSAPRAVHSDTVFTMFQPTPTDTSVRPSDIIIILIAIWNGFRSAGGLSVL